MLGFPLGRGVLVEERSGITFHDAIPLEKPQSSEAVLAKEGLEIHPAALPYSSVDFRPPRTTIH